CALGGSFDYW
nr:immunoglobulin heavy chain junction region [Mus musculus]